MDRPRNRAGKGEKFWRDGDHQRIPLDPTFNVMDHFSSLLFLWPLVAGFVLDAIIGDPETKYHPIRFIGRLVNCEEKILYETALPKRLAGILLVCATMAITLGIGLGISWFFFQARPLLGYAWSIFIFYAGLAFRSLLDAGEAVARDLRNGDLHAARRHLSRIVSRETKDLPEQDVVRGTIESLSENLSDAIIAPLFYAFLFGIGGIIFYKTANTLDSMIGYKTERYMKFGWCAARLDDVLNFIPARVAFLFVLAASFLLRYDVASCWTTVLRQSQTGESPNGGIGICAFAGALGIQLGGTNYFGGRPAVTPTIGIAKHEISVDHIRQSKKLIVASTIIGFAAFFIARVALSKLM